MTLSRAYWLVGAVTFSKIGTIAYTIVMTWVISQAGGNSSVGWVNAVAGLTIVLVGFSATVWLDWFDKRIMLLVLDGAAAIVCLIAATTLFLFPGRNVITIGIIVAIATAAAASLYAPTSRALVPSIVPAEELESFNSTYTGVGEISRTIGPAVGALLLSVGGTEAFPLSLLINSLSFCISFLLTLPLPSDPPNRCHQFQNHHRFLQQVRFIKGHVILRGEVLSALSINFLLPSTTFILLNRIAEMNARPYMFGLANFFEAVGAVMAALIAAVGAAHLKFVLASQLTLPIAVFVLFFLPHTVWTTILSLTIVSALATIYNIVFFSRLQREIPRERVGRVLALVTTTSAALKTFGNLVFSKVSTLVPTNSLIWFISLSLLATGLCISFLTRTRMKK